MIDDQVETVQQPPENKGPCRTMPQATQYHGRHQVKVTPTRSLHVATERNIEIVTQETGQGDVPTTPEINDRTCLIRRIEINRQTDTEHAGQTERHVAIARKIEIDLEGIGNRAEPCGFKRHRSASIRMTENQIDDRGDTIRQHDLLEQTDRKQCATDSQIEHQLAAENRQTELWDRVFLQNDRPCDQLRKEDHEQTIFREIALCNIPFIGVIQE